MKIKFSPKNETGKLHPLDNALISALRKKFYELQIYYMMHFIETINENFFKTYKSLNV